MPGLPDFPVNLGANAIQVDTPSDYGRDVYDTDRGKFSTRDTPRPPVINPVQEWGRYNP